MARLKKAAVVLSSYESAPDFCRRTVKDNIIFSKHIPLLGLDLEYAELYKLIMRTIDRAESNSALVIGPRGSGKTTLVNKVLEEAQENSLNFKDTIVVHLNGYIHTDDRLSLKGITAQMKLENCVGDKVFGSFAENLTFLLQCLSAGSQKTSKSVIFILDEFDLFCNHGNQTLLYNLFDIAQSAQAPICVLGLTCRNDVTDLFEKRVLSRFSSRQIHINPSAEETDAETFARRLKLMQCILTVPNEEACSQKKEWNNSIKELCEDSSVQGCIKRMLNVSLCETTFRNFLFLVVSKVDDSHPILKPNDFVVVYDRMKSNTTVKILEGLSVLELCLIISMKHQTEIYDGNPFNFEMILRRYLKFSHFHSMMNVDRQVILKAFENLKRLELIQLGPSGGGQLLREFQLFNLLVLPDEIKEAVNNYHGLPTEVQQWAMSDLT